MKWRVLTGVVVGVTLSLLITWGVRSPIGQAGPSPIHPAGGLSKPEGVDLDVTYLSRTPRYQRYDVLYTWDGRPYLRPGTEGAQRWPAHGEVVTFTAHVMNKGTAASGDFDFAWAIDGATTLSGTLPGLAPGGELTATCTWTWAHHLDGERLLGTHRVAFEVDPDDVISETYQSNNRLEEQTGALSLRLALTPALYEALETPVDPQWPFSAEDWLQKQIAAMNEAFAHSTYPAASAGIEERVRLDEILVTSAAPPAGLSLDGSFFMSGDDRYGNPYYHAATDVSGALIHELTHQLGIIDLYNLDVALEIPQVEDAGGNPVQVEYWPAFNGLMSNPGIDPPIYAEHTALALNANRGYRRGYYGEYLYDVPAPTSIRVLDSAGDPAPGVSVNFYQRASSPNVLGSRHGVIDAVAEISVTTALSGAAVLPDRPVGEPVTTCTGHTLTDNPLGLINVVGRNDEFLVELRRGSHQEFQWLDVTAFNLAAGRGSSILTMTTHVPPPEAPAPPPTLSGEQAYGKIALAWSPSPSATVTGYTLYRTDGSAAVWQPLLTGLTAPSATVDYDSSARAVGFAITAVDAAGHESGFSPLFWALRLRNPSDLVVAGDRRIVLDPQNGYALLLQSPDGRFVDTMGSFDLHLENSHYLARDADGRLFISHPGDDYSSRHSVRVTDPQGTQILEFGDYGSGPGQFNNPAGVAIWESPPRRVLVVDRGNHRLQVFDDGGAFVAAYGAHGSGPGEFESPQGIAINSAEQVIVVDSGNDRLQVFDFDGTTFSFVREIAADLDGATAGAAHGGDRIVVADTGHDAIRVFDGAGALLGTYTAPDAAYGGTFNAPRGVAIDGFARILVADTGNRRVVALSGALPPLPPASVTLTGPGVGTSNVPQAFTAAVGPLTATLPLTYVWEATGQSPVTHVRDGYTDTITYTWTVSGSETITVTASNRGGAVTTTRRMLIDPPHQVFLPLVARNYPPGPHIHYFRADVEIADPGDTIELSWASSGATGATLYHLLPTGQFGTFWSVEPTGVMTYEIPTATRNFERFALFVHDDEGRVASASLYLELTCPDAWFFEPAPDECPSGPAEIGPGAEEHFEHGLMLWVGSLDRIYVLFDDGSPAWSAYTDEWDPGDPISDPGIEPPPGYYQPVRGFGLVWREQPNVRERLGWAIEPEVGYETAYQRTARYKYNEFYIKARDGGVWHLYPEMSDWEYMAP